MSPGFSFHLKISDILKRDVISKKSYYRPRDFPYREKLPLRSLEHILRLAVSKPVVIK